jgi:hypothetical protein
MVENLQKATDSSSALRYDLALYFLRGSVIRLIVKLGIIARKLDQSGMGVLIAVGCPPQSKC